MKIKDIDLGPRPVFLAPMEDVTDLLSADVQALRSRHGIYRVRFCRCLDTLRSKTQQKLNISDEERPVAIQIYGRDTATMVEAARIVEQAHPDTLDQLRLPREARCGKGAGAGMLQNIPLMLEITRAW